MALSSHPTQDVSLEALGRSWSQENRDAFAWTKLPLMLVKGVRSQVKDTVYRIPDLDNFMLKGGGYDWDPGDALPQHRTVEETAITVTPEGKITSPRKRTAKRSGADLSRLADLENLVPPLMGEAYQIIEKALVAFLTNTTNFGTAKSFSGTDTIDSVDSDGTQQPLRDIETNLRSLRKYQDRVGFELWCICDAKVIDVLRQHADYHGGGAASGGGGSGSGTAGSLTADAFLATFQAQHRIDKVIMSTAVVDTVREGQTSALQEAAHGLFWFGVVDTRNMRADLRENSGNTDTNPDGALVLAQAIEPFVDSDPGDALSEVELFAGKVDFDILSPRGSAFGHFYDSATIFA